MRELARKALQAIREEGRRVTEHNLIEMSLRKIGEAWQTGTLEWMKRTRPNDFEKMVTLEIEINRMVLEHDINSLREVLKNYEELMVRMVEVFRSPTRETGGSL